MRWFWVLLLTACAKRETSPASLDAAAPPALSVAASSSAASTASAAASAAAAPTEPSEPFTFSLGDAGSEKRFRRVKLEASDLGKLLAPFAEVKRLGPDLRYFTEGDIHAIQNRSSVPHEGIAFSTQPIVWSPEGDVEILVATGRSKSTSFVVALFPQADGGFALASSFLMLNDVSPVTLAWDPKVRKELKWSSCWGCNGEEGFVSWRSEEHRVVIVQR